MASSAPSGALSLCIDTCGPSLLLVIGDGRKPCAFHYEAMAKGQAEVIFPALDTVLADLGRSAQTPFTHIGVTVGPGSFTGLRVGLAVAKARAVVDGCCVHPVNRLQMMARAQQLSDKATPPVIVALDARRSEHFVQTFDADLRPLDAPETLPNAQVAAWKAGQLAAHQGAVISVEGASSPAVMAQALLEETWAAPGIPHHDVKPLYIRPPDAKPPNSVRFTIDV